MDKKTKIILLVLFFMLQLGIIFSGIIKKEITLNKGDSLKILIKPIDPYDAFRGSYLVLGYDDTIILKEGDKGYSEYKRGDKVYAVYREDEDGYHVVDYITKDKPRGRNYIKTSIKYKYKTSNPYINQKKVGLDLPYNRYYIDNRYAQDAENLVRGRSEKAYIIVKAYRGNAVISDLYVNELKIIDYIKHSK